MKEAAASSVCYVCLYVYTGLYSIYLLILRFATVDRWPNDAYVVSLWSGFDSPSRQRTHTTDESRKKDETVVQCFCVYIEDTRSRYICFLRNRYSFLSKEATFSFWFSQFIGILL